MWMGVYGNKGGTESYLTFGKLFEESRRGRSPFTWHDMVGVAQIIRIGQ